MKKEHIMNGARWRLLVVSLWLPLASCSLLVDFPGDEGRPCDGAGQCATGYYCKDGTCVPGTAYPLTVTVSGAGSGTVTSAPAGLNCSSGSCTSSFVSGTEVTLTATPGGSSFFAGWSGEGCGGGGPCTVSMSAAKAVTATFTPGYTLAVSLVGNGSGSVTSTPAGINCPAGSCVAGYASGTTVTLTASPTAGSTFTGWSGGCSGTGTCTIPLTAATTVSASFVLTTYTLSVALAGGASGIVTSVPAGINCPTACTADYVSGTTVTLSAASGGNSAFRGWSGGGCSGTGTCTVTMTAATSVVATFDPGFPVSVSMTGTGSGTVTSNPAGISCPSGNCTFAFFTGSAVTLTAKPNIGSYFAGWTGDCTGPNRFCTVSVSQARNVTANFMAQTYNTVFVTSSAMAANLGLAAYDAECNARATAAGLNDATGNAYVAWMTTSGTNMTSTSRLGTARGFVRVDGRPFADDLNSLLNNNKVLNSIRLDENGADVGNASVWTGLRADGYPYSSNCNNWASTSGSGYSGTTAGGPEAWTVAGTTSCAMALRTYCFMKTKNVVLTTVPTIGKRIFISPSVYWCTSYGVSDADSRCSSQLGGARAMLPTVNPARAASDLLSSQALYVRPDGQAVGTKAQILAGTMESGIWQDGAGNYYSSGSYQPLTVTTTPAIIPTDPASTCSDWSSTSGSATLALGEPRFADNRWWSSGTTTNCNCFYAQFYCVEQ